VLPTKELAVLLRLGLILIGLTHVLIIPNAQHSSIVKKKLEIAMDQGFALIGQQCAHIIIRRFVGAMAEHIVMSAKQEAMVLTSPILENADPALT
jgi:hypothetical protein